MNAERLNQLTVISWRLNSASISVYDLRDLCEIVELDLRKWMTNENKLIRDGCACKVS